MLLKARRMLLCLASAPTTAPADHTACLHTMHACVHRAGRTEKRSALHADTLLELAVAVLGMETMLVSLLDGNRKFILAASGFLTSGHVPGPSRPSATGRSVPSLHQMVVVEDTLEGRQASSCTLPRHLSH